MKNEFDNRLTDKGWRSMRGALDREMPRKRRRRPVAWWWLGVLILIPLAGAGGWWWYRSGKPAQSPDRPPVEKEVARQPVVDAGSNEGQIEINTNVQPDKPVTALSAISSAVGVNKNAFTPTDPDNGREEAIGSPDGSPTATSPETPVFTASMPEVSGLPAKMTLLVALPEKERYLRFETSAKPVFSQVSPVEQTGIKKKLNTPRRWSVGLMAGINSENLSGLNGFSSGIAVDWQPLRKWGLRTGIQYARYRPSAQERPVVSLDNTEYADATGNFAVIQDVGNNPGTGNPSTDQSNQKVLVPVDRLQRLEMPLLAFWQPVRSLRLFGGATVSRNLSTDASKQNYANNKIYVADNKSALENLNNLTSSNLPRWRINTLFGAGLHLGKHFELGVFYQPSFGRSGNGANADSSFNGSFNGSAWPLAGNAGSADLQSRFFLNGILFF